MKIQNLTIGMRDTLTSMAWDEKELARIALSYLTRKGLLDDFESYLARVAKNERTKP
jgi:hypothetical protein